MKLSVEHRPWPLPRSPWIMVQNWQDLLLAHWPVETGLLRQVTPPGLEIDTYRGKGWIGVVPFRMTRVRPRCTPALPALSAFPEINVRSYVVADNKPGIFFYSLDAANPVAVWLARRFFHLSYFHAHMSCRTSDGRIQYQSRRTDPLGPPVEFRAEYWPLGKPFLARQGTLDYWLTERYCMYSVDSKGRLYRGEIHHLPWRLQVAAANIEINRMTEPYGSLLPDSPPLLHFAKFQRALIWLVRKIAT